MNDWGWIVTGVLGALVGACGAEEACGSALSVNRQIVSAAATDMISTDGLCRMDKSGIAARLNAAGHAGGNPAAISDRADQYVGACQKLTSLQLECGE